MLHAFQHLSVYTSECLLLMLLLLCGKLQKTFQEENNRDISYPIIANYCQISVNKQMNTQPHAHSFICYVFWIQIVWKWKQRYYCLLLITFLNTLLPKCIWWYSTIWPTHLHIIELLKLSAPCYSDICEQINNETYLLLNIRFFYILINYLIPNSHSHNNELINFIIMISIVINSTIYCNKQHYT